MAPPGRILFARKETLLCLRLEGRITFALASGFADFIEKIFTHDTWAEIFVDLTATTAIDSTGLGLLAKIARLMRQRRNQTITVISTNEKITGALRSVGLDRLVTIAEPTDHGAENLQELPAGDAIQAARTKVVLDAHRELVALNEKNAAEFRTVVEYLKQASQR